MTKDEIIVLLKEQLQLANEQLQLANDTVSSLTIQVGELIERIKSLEEQLVLKGITIDKVNRQNRALGKLVCRGFPQREPTVGKVFNDSLHRHGIDIPQLQETCCKGRCIG